MKIENVADLQEFLASVPPTCEVKLVVAYNPSDCNAVACRPLGSVAVSLDHAARPGLPVVLLYSKGAR